MIDAYGIEFNLQIHALAAHNFGDYKGITPGLGIIARKDELLAAAGFYRNSNGNPSQYVYIGAQPLKVGDWKFGGALAAVTGYNGGTKYGPLGIVSYGGINFTVAPANKRGVVAIGISYEF